MTRNKKLAKRKTSQFRTNLHKIRPIDFSEAYSEERTGFSGKFRHCGNNPAITGVCGFLVGPKKMWLGQEGNVAHE